MSAAIDTRPVVRVASWDAFRGLAVVFMVVDHIAAVTGSGDLLRLVPGRVAMPMFFLLAGYLARSPRWRHAAIGWVGIALPFFVPWIDSPNVLLVWAVGVVVLWTARRIGLPVWLFAAFALTLAANDWIGSSGGFNVWALLGLMALGSMLPASAFSWAGRLPRPFAMIGRNPVAWYLGHLAVLQLVAAVA